MGSYKSLHEHTILGGLAPEERTEGAVQYQSGGSLGQDPDLTYNPTSNELTVEDVITTTLTASGTVTANGTLTLPGGQKDFALGTSQNTTDATITALNTDTFIACGLNGAVAVNLPPAATAAGQILLIMSVGGASTAITITPNASEGINGAANLVMPTGVYKVRQIFCTGATWLVIGAV